MNGRKALIVGIDEYGHNSLKCAVSDAEIVNKLLSNNADGSINFETKMLSGNIQRKELLSSIKQLFSGRCDCALLYYAGHGLIDSAGGYLVTSDCDDCESGVSMTEIMNIVNSSECDNCIVILDCCRSGFIGKVTSRDASVINEGVTIMTACRDKEYADEDPEGIKHGIFSSLIINGMMGAAADIMGNVTPSGLYSYVDSSLGPWEQRPIFKTNVSSFTVLRKSTPSIDRSTLCRTLEYFDTSGRILQLDPSFEFTNNPDYKIVPIEPYTNDKNVRILKDLQKLERVGLVEPIDADHMYFAAMNKKWCHLTAIGRYYWNLHNDHKI